MTEPSYLSTHHCHRFERLFLSGNCLENLSISSYEHYLTPLSLGATCATTGARRRGCKRARPLRDALCVGIPERERERDSLVQV